MDQHQIALGAEEDDMVVPTSYYDSLAKNNNDRLDLAKEQLAMQKTQMNSNIGKDWANVGTGMGNAVGQVLQSKWAADGQIAKYKADTEKWRLQTQSEWHKWEVMKSIEMRKTAVAETVAELQADVRDKEIRASVEITKINRAADAKCAGIKQRAITNRMNSALAHKAFQRNSYRSL